MCRYFWSRATSDTLEPKRVASLRYRPCHDCLSNERLSRPEDVLPELPGAEDGLPWLP